MALTDTKVRSAKPQEKEYTLVDGDGMFLLIHPNGSKYWRFRFRFGGKQHLMAFGVYPETSLADARQKREEARRLVAAGIDPREHKRAVKEEQAKEAITFESVAREWHATNKKWSEEHSRRVLKSLEDNLFSAIGRRSIEELKTRDLLAPIKIVEATVNRPGFPGECFICELRLPDHRFRWKHNKLFLLLPVGYGPAFPAIVDCYTSPPT